MADVKKPVVTLNIPIAKTFTDKEGKDVDYTEYSFNINGIKIVYKLKDSTAKNIVEAYIKGGE